MLKHGALTLAVALPLAACGGETPTAADADALSPETPALAQVGSEGLIRKDIPEEDPGPPLYARVTDILDQFFHTDGWLGIPFYRDPSCIEPDFNMLALFDFPGPAGPGAFGCDLRVTGFLLIEPDAPLGTFPKQAVLQGDAVPVWFIPWSEFEVEAADGVVTFAELQAMSRLTGTADRYHETLRPREGEHFVSIQSRGTLEDGRSFLFSVLQEQERILSVQIRFR